jgi:hypothetical protein
MWYFVVDTAQVRWLHSSRVLEDSPSRKYSDAQAIDSKDTLAFSILENIGLIEAVSRHCGLTLV